MKDKFYIEFTAYSEKFKEWHCDVMERLEDGSNLVGTVYGASEIKATKRAKGLIKYLKTEV